VFFESAQAEVVVFHKTLFLLLTQNQINSVCPSVCARVAHAAAGVEEDGPANSTKGKNISLFETTEKL